MALQNASTFIKVALIMVAVGIVVDVIGFATPYWQDFEIDRRTPGYNTFNRIISIRKLHSGLWKTCVNDYPCQSFGDMASWFEATQAFETLGFLAAIGALVLIILYIFVPQTAGKKIIFILSMLACFAAAGCILLGIIIYGSKVERNLSWSFALCCIGGIIFGVSGILLVVDMLKR